MPRYGTVKVGSRIFFLLLLNIVLIVGSVLALNYLGVIDTRKYLGPIYSLFGLRQPSVVETLDDPNLLDNQRYDKQWEALDIRNAELDAREAEIAQKEIEQQEREQSLEIREKEIEEKQKTLNDRINSYDNKIESLRDVAGKLGMLEYDQATKILLAMEDREIIDILRMTDTLAAERGLASVTSEWIGLMPAQRSSEILRKMGITPVN